MGKLVEKMRKLGKDLACHTERSEVSLNLKRDFSPTAQNDNLRADFQSPLRYGVCQSPLPCGGGLGVGILKYSRHIIESIRKKCEKRRHCEATQITHALTRHCEAWHTPKQSITHAVRFWREFTLKNTNLYPKNATKSRSGLLRILRMLAMTGKGALSRSGLLRILRMLAMTNSRAFVMTKERTAL